MKKQILFTGLILITFNVCAENLSQKHKDGLIRGHITSCVPTIKKQIVDLGLKVSETNIEQYCGCIAHKYFDDFTKKEFDHVTRTGQLPERVLRNRLQIQNGCSYFLVAQKKSEKKSDLILTSSEEELRKALLSQNLSKGTTSSGRANPFIEMLRSAKFGIKPPEPVLQEPVEPQPREDISGLSLNDLIRRRAKRNPNYIDALDNEYIGQDVVIDEEKISEPNESKKEYNNIYNTCMLDKSSDVDMNIRSLRIALIDTCKSIAEDPSWLEKLRYN